MLKSADIHNLLPAIEPERVNEPRASYTQPQEINSLDDLLGDDALNLLGDDSEGLFDFKHTPQDNERADADFIARRKPCKDFEQYEAVFKEIQKDVKRKAVPLFHYGAAINDAGRLPALHKCPALCW